MKNKIKRISHIEFQTLAPPEGLGIILEFLDENEDAFMEVNIDDDGVQHLVIYDTPKLLSIPLLEMKRALSIAEKKVIDLGLDSLFGEN